LIASRLRYRCHTCRLPATDSGPSRRTTAVLSAAFFPDRGGIIGTSGVRL